MDKKAFDIHPAAAGVAALGLGAVGAIGGYGVAKKKGAEALANQTHEFAEYNQKENAAIAEEAFNKGLQYEAEQLQKTSAAVQAKVLVKMAGAAQTGFLGTLKGAFKDIYSGGIQRHFAINGETERGLKKIEESVAGSVSAQKNGEKLIGAAAKPKEFASREKLLSQLRDPEQRKVIKETLNQGQRDLNRPELYKNLAAIGVTGAAAGGGMYLKNRGMSKESSHKAAIKTALKDLFTSGIDTTKKWAKHKANAVKDLEMTVPEYVKNETAYKQTISSQRRKNLLMGALAGTAAVGGGAAANDFYQRNKVKNIA